METPKEALTTLSHSSGVYLYRDKNGTILYIGKAKDLKKRITTSEKTKLLFSQIFTVETIETASEFDALLLEAKLIHEHTPKYNVVLKDDKSPLYVLLTLSEVLPHVLTVRKSDLKQSSIGRSASGRDALFGPFQSATMVRSMLRHLRHIIPFCTQKKRTGTSCFYSHIGLCNPCPSDKNTNPTEYRKNIFRLKNILSGKSTTVLQELEKDMAMAARENRFEEAAALRNHIQNLRFMMQKRYDPMLYIDSSVENIYKKELSALSSLLDIPTLHRIECIDISNISGNYAVGSLVVLTDGKKDTSQYRRFKIKHKQSPNDVAMIAEVTQRRFHHPEWGAPDLFIVDGGKAQIHAALSHVPCVPVIGLAKRFEEIIVPQGNDFKILRIPYTSPALHVVERIRDEAHRFAITYHRLLRKKGFL